MAPRVGVAVIHGMGSQDEKFAAKFEAALLAALKREKAKPADVVIQPIWWAEVVASRQRDLLDRLNEKKDLEWGRLRAFIVQALGDAIAYQKTVKPTAGPAEETRIYELVHKVIGREMHALAGKVGPNAPLVVVAHSLGCHMMSNFIYDADHRLDENDCVIDKNSPFETFKTLTSIFTFGCNIPLFLLANNRYEPIAFPPDLSGVFPGKDPRAVAKWINFYDPDDALGFPLKPLSPQFRKTVDEDRAINAGSFLTSWSPLSHTGYWTDDDVIKPIAKVLGEILKLLG
jgi:hypothetical protein